MSPSFLTEKFKFRDLFAVKEGLKVLVSFHWSLRVVIKRSCVREGEGYRWFSPSSCRAFCLMLSNHTFASLEVILGIISWLLLKGFAIFFFVLSIKQNALNTLFCLFKSLLI